MSLATLSKCPVPDCPCPPCPWFCQAHWPFISDDVRGRLARFGQTFRGGRDAAPPPTMLKLLKRALKDIRTHPLVQWNWADRLAVWLHRVLI